MGVATVAVLAVAGAVASNQQAKSAAGRANAARRANEARQKKIQEAGKRRDPGTLAADGLISPEKPGIGFDQRAKTQSKSLLSTDLENTLLGD